MFGVSNAYFPFAGNAGLPIGGWQTGFDMQTPRYSIFDNNIFGMTPTYDMCAMPTLGYSTPNAYLQPFNFLGGFGFGMNPFMGFMQPFGMISNIFGSIMPQINNMFSSIFNPAGFTGGAPVLPTPTTPAVPTIQPPTLNTSGIFGCLGTTSVCTTSTPTTSTTSSTTSSRPRVTGTAPKVSEALRLAESQVGIAEINKSNDSPEIRKYKNGAANNNAWCASFASWLFGAGQGSNNASTFGYTSSSQKIKREAQKAGYYSPVNSGYKPQVGDLMILSYSDGIHGHVGIVTKVNNDGSFETIEGNYSDKVSRVKRSMHTRDLNGFVRMNEWLQA